ncbi:leucine-rich repeat and guanylate kinase domain-containing protein isoform X2 [Protopterus annectens]|uniref:leucine-rich repeat and guanylate kinase domain-containing protein isoform X2 n=1 Tax=Protopterus annectens TaxID=7888 RepID=UPI001CFB7F53|nr:leucine-rich repeat and guanylate kinase domain-containing protein isoform X2 [Protopterus annectens]
MPVEHSAVDSSEVLPVRIEFAVSGRGTHTNTDPGKGELSDDSCHSDETESHRLRDRECATQQCDLSNISVLSEYTYLQKLVIPHNKIQDLSCISCMPHLIELDVSHNEINGFFNFKPPKYLKVVNFAYNRISKMKDLSAYQALAVLILDNNNLSEIQGLEKCRSLIHLSLANNKITELKGLANLPIKTLCLSGNLIQNVSGLENIKTLHNLDLQNNKIQSLRGMENHDLLEMINLQNNQIMQFGELEFLQDLPILRVLNLVQNPVQEHADYWLSVIFLLPKLTMLDKKKVQIEEKVAAMNKYDPPPEVIAAQDHITHIMYSMLQPQKIFDSTLPSLDTPYPMLVLTGPQACGKRELAHRLCREFSDFFAYGVSHTTRQPYLGEENGRDYHYVSPEVFEAMISLGKFIETVTYNGNYYGLSRDAVELVAGDGLACCVHMELEGVRSLKNSYFEPRYILLIPLDKEEYERRLRRRGLYSRSQINTAVSRVDTYIKMNQDYPGYFDTVINSDDVDEAYKTLSQLLREYLGLSEDSSTTGDVDLTSHKARPGSVRWTPVEPKNRGSPSGMMVSKISSPAAKNGFSDSSTKNYSARVQAKLSAQKTMVEEASIQRRQQAAREALQGKTPSAYTSLFKRHSETAPAHLGPRQKFPDSASYTSMLPTGSNITQDRSFPPASPDSSSESRASSGLSMLSSAGAFSSEESPPASSPSLELQKGLQGALESLGIAGLGLELEKLNDEQNSSSTPGTPRPISEGALGEKTEINISLASPRVTTLPPRPGTNTKPILPPIPSGRKMADV